MRRRSARAPTCINAAARLSRSCFSGPGLFAERLDAIEREYRNDPARWRDRCFRPQPFRPPALSARRSPRGLDGCRPMSEPMRTSPVGIICGGGSLPFAVADAIMPAARPARHPVCDPEHRRSGPHRALSASLGRARASRAVPCRLAQKEGCRDIVFIGTVVRPATQAACGSIGRPSACCRESTRSIAAATTIC